MENEDVNEKFNYAISIYEENDSEEEIFLKLKKLQELIIKTSNFKEHKDEK